MRGVSTTAAPSRSYPWRGEGRGRQQRTASKPLALGRPLFAGVTLGTATLPSWRKIGGGGRVEGRRGERLGWHESGFVGVRRDAWWRLYLNSHSEPHPEPYLTSPLFTLPPHIPSGVETAGSDMLTTRGLFSVPGTRIFGRCPRFAKHCRWRSLQELQKELRLSLPSRLPCLHYYPPCCGHPASNVPHRHPRGINPAPKASLPNEVTLPSW
jgi:hypothetical protein